MENLVNKDTFLTKIFNVNNAHKDVKLVKINLLALIVINIILYSKIIQNFNANLVIQ